MAHTPVPAPAASHTLALPPLASPAPAADAGAPPAADAGVELSPREHLAIARELEQNRQLLEAVRHASIAARDAAEQRDDATTRDAKDTLRVLLGRVPKVTFEPPDDVTDLHVSFDERPVPTLELRKWFSVDPGRHTVHATAMRDGAPVGYDTVVDLVDAEKRTIPLGMTPMAGACLTCGSTRCISEARSDEEAQACLAPARTRPGCRACTAAPADAPPTLALAAPALLFFARRALRRARR